MNRAIGKYKCPCCGFYTFDEKLNGNYDICPVCFWEDDPIQLMNIKVELIELVSYRQGIIFYCLVHVKKK